MPAWGNYPDDVRENDPRAPWNQKYDNECPRCGDEIDDEGNCVQCHRDYDPDAQAAARAEAQEAIREAERLGDYWPPGD